MTNLLGFFSPYLAIFTLISSFIYPYHRVSDYHKGSIKLVCLLVFVLFFGLHGNVGDDFVAYKSLYDNLSVYDVQDFEPGFLLFAWLFKLLNLPFWCFILGCSCVINGLFFVFLWKSEENIPFVLCIFLAMSGIMLEMNYIRSTISLMLFANSIVFLQLRNIKLFVALNAIGILFHYSAIIYLFLYFLLTHKFTRKSVAVMVACGCIISLFRIPLLAPFSLILEMFQSETIAQLSSYYLSTDMYLGISLGTAERLLTVIAVLYFYDRLTDKAIGVIAVNSFLLYFFFYSFLSAYAMLGIRMANMFILGYWLLWPMVLKCIDQRKLKISISALMLFYMAVRIAGLNNLPQWQYKTILITN